MSRCKQRGLAIAQRDTNSAAAGPKPAEAGFACQPRTIKASQMIGARPLTESLLLSIAVVDELGGAFLNFVQDGEQITVRQDGTVVVS